MGGRSQLQLTNELPQFVCRHPTALAEIFAVRLRADLGLHAGRKVVVRRVIKVNRCTHGAVQFFIAANVLRLASAGNLRLASPESRGRWSSCFSMSPAPEQPEG